MTRVQDAPDVSTATMMNYRKDTHDSFGDIRINSRSEIRHLSSQPEKAKADKAVARLWFRLPPPWRCGAVMTISPLMVGRQDEFV